MSQNRFRMVVCAAGALVMACGLAQGIGESAEAPVTGTLRLKTGIVRLDDSDSLLRRVARPGVRVDGARVIVLDGPITPERRAQIENAGVRLGEYLPDHAYVADLSGADLEAVRGLGFVTWAGAYRSEWKVSPDLGLVLRTHDQALLAIQERGELAVRVWLFPGADRDAALEGMNAIGGVRVVADSLEGDRRLVQVTAARENALKLAEIPQVMWVEDAPEITFRNNTSRWIVQSNQPGFYPIYDAGIHGEDQLIAVMDGRVDVDHCSFLDPEGDPIGPDHRKVEAFNQSMIFSDSHGTHVAGSALGDSGAFDNSRGVAYMSRMIFNTTPAFTQNGINQRLTLHSGQGARIHTNSWGNDGTTDYDGLTRGLDDYSWLNDDNLVLFAVTNLSSLRNPENAKNVLAVAASGDTPIQEVQCTGGAGPTNDGRRKPEITAPGCGIQSSDNNTVCSTFSSTGTSMACPQVAGAAALVRQYFMEGFYPTGVATPGDAMTPSGPLMKAMLLNSAQDMTNESGYPGNKEGWGRVKLNETLVFPGAEGVSESIVVRDVRNNTGEALDTGETFEVPFEVTQALSALRVTLVWHDAPASLPAIPAAVNNLDLEIITPDVTFLGNVLSGGTSVPGGAPDEDNNVEMVITTAISAGSYMARVKGTNVAVGSQGYALVIRGMVQEAMGPQGCNAADLSEPYGVLDFDDVLAYLTAFGAMDSAADLALPVGVFDFNDVLAFLGAFGAGCP